MNEKIHIVNKINHKNSYFAFVDDREYSFEVVNGKIHGFISERLKQQIKILMELCEKQNIMPWER